MRDYPANPVSDTIIRIRKIENGFVVCANDPKIQEANNNPKTPYQDPEQEYSFPTLEKCLKWIKDNAELLVPSPDSDEEYETAFKGATATEK